MFVLRYRMPSEINYQYITSVETPETPENAIETHLFGPFSSEQEATEFIDQQSS